MAIIPKSTLYDWFRRKKKPTQEQFWAVFDSFDHKSETIPLNRVEGIDQFLQGTTPMESFSAHLDDSSAHSLYLSKKDASNLSSADIISWKSALQVGVIPENVALVDLNESPSVYNKPQIDLKLAAININLVSEDQSLLIENDTKNIESNVSIFSEEFENHPTSIVSISFEPIQILGVYDGGLKLNTNEYEQPTPTRINLTGVRKYTLIPELQNMIEVQYTHLKTDI